ncbi:MAG: c-type cytochrome [Mariprofundaceae bacterium]
MKKYFATMLAALAVAAFMATPVMASDTSDGAKIFKGKCKMCHHMTRKKMGPAVKNMNADVEVLKTTIKSGRKSMPKYGSKLSDAEIDAVVAYLKAQQGNNPCAK